jgi:hypothetical protein
LCGADCREEPGDGADRDRGADPAATAGITIAQPLLDA